MKKIFVMNLGGSSSKVAIFYNKELKYEKTIRHSNKDMSKYRYNQEQVDYRLRLIQEWFAEIGFSVEDLSAISLRGGGLPFKETKKGGTYLIDKGFRDIILDEYDKNNRFHHGVYISLPIALELLKDNSHINIYVTDPPTVTELLPVAKIAGHPKFERRAVFHALNQKAVGRKIAEKYNKKYDDLKLIVTHMGAGISIGVHQNGRIIDVNNNSTGDGPMAPVRAGQLPMGQLVELCFSGEYNQEEILLMIRGQSGVQAYLGTSDMREVEQMIKDGNKEAKLIWDAVVYQVAKEIGSAFAVLNGEVDYLIFTGGIAYSEKMIFDLTEKIGSFGKVEIVPGEFENEGLALGALRVLNNEEEAILSE